MPYTTIDDFRLRPPPVTVYGGSERDEAWGIDHYHTTRHESIVVNSTGLSQYEMSALDTFPKGLLKVVADEMDDPEFVSYLRWRLHQPNAAAKVEADLAEEIYDELFGDDYEYPPEEFVVPGLGKGLSKKFKKVRKKVTGVIKKVPGLNKAYAFHKKIHRKVKKALKPYMGIILGIAGVILAPLTGGLSIAAATAITAGMKAYEAKKAAVVAKKQAKAEASVMNAEAKKEEAKAEAELDKFFNESKEYWAEYDVTPEKWAKLTFEAKLELVKAANEGRLPKSENAAAIASGPEQAAAETSGPTPPEPGCQVAGGLTDDQLTTWRNAGWRMVESGGARWACPPREGAPPPTTGTVPAASPSGNYDVWIEGKKVTTVGSAEAAAEVVGQMAQRADRVEVMYNGQSTGMRVKTDEAYVDVPPEAVEATRNASHEQMVEVVDKAEKKGGFPGWILIPVAAGAALFAAKA